MDQLQNQKVRINEGISNLKKQNMQNQIQIMKLRAELADVQDQLKNSKVSKSEKHSKKEKHKKQA